MDITSPFTRQETVSSTEARRMAPPTSGTLGPDAPGFASAGLGALLAR